MVGLADRGTAVTGHGERPRRGPEPGDATARLRSYAALDLGTNSCRLLVARPAPHGFQVVDGFSRIVRLGEGVEFSGALSEVAMGRALAALRICAAKMKQSSVAAARSVATAACRRARNCETFLDLVRVETGIELEIISIEEEARLALSGCASLFEDGAKHALMFDIGGGSTQLVWVAIGERGAAGRPRILGLHALPFGVVTLAERFGGRHVLPGTHEAMVRQVATLLEPFEQRHGIGKKLAAGAVQMLGTSGTLTTLAAVHLGLRRYDRTKVDGQLLSFAELSAVMDRLTGMNYRERVAQSCIGRQRADLVLAGAAILAAICRVWPVGRLWVADRGLREGILLGLMGSPPALASPAG